jgi:hypothetical protein
MSASKTRQEYEEDVCAAIAASTTGTRWRRRDRGGQQIVDFELEFPDGAVEALEVSSFTDETVREQWQVLRELGVLAPSLASSWTISVRRGAKVKRLPSQAESQLAVFERHDRTQFLDGEHYQLEASGAPPDLAAAAADLIRLGVREAMRAPELEGKQPRIFVAAGVGGPSRPAFLINSAVQAVAHKRDNRLKLQGARAARRRHVFVPIDASAGPTWTIVRDPPTAPPRLPSGVEVAWVVGANGCTLRAELPDGWQPVTVDPAVWDDPSRWCAESAGSR